MKLFIILAAFLAASASAQEQCGCAAPAPVVIQLSCGGNSPQQPPPLPPQECESHPPTSEEEHPPFEHHEEEAPAEEYFTTALPEDFFNALPEDNHNALPEEIPQGPFSRVQDDPRRSTECIWKNSGLGDYFLTFDYLHNDKPATKYMWLEKWDNPNFDRYDNIKWYNADESTKPPRGWDGSFDSLPYPKPEEDSVLYKWLLCYPLVPQEEESHEWSILHDPNRALCDWKMNYDHSDDVGGHYRYYGYPHGHLQGGFLMPYRIVDELMGGKKEVEAPEGFQRPPHDWDGRASTLGFPIPPMYTPEYNMLLCWPYDFTLKAGTGSQFTPALAPSPSIAGRR